MQDLINEIKGIKVHKSSGIPNVSTKIWKIVFSTIPEKLLFVFNKSLETGEYPNAWKQATIIPIPKTDSPTEAGDFRPIALLPIPGKILERLTQKQIVKYLETHNLLENNQNGFRANHSTINTCFKFTTDLLLNKNKNCDSLAVFLDFKKAFDTVDHEILVNKLKRYNFSDRSRLWVANYLKNRTQTTLINNNRSQTKQVLYGVPQGSVLGPTFFIIYINDLVDHVTYSSALLYAGDTVLYHAVNPNDTHSDIRKLQHDLSRVEHWCQQNKLTINVKKTKLMYFPATHDRNCMPEIELLGSTLPSITCYKYLGLDVDHKLTFMPHLNSLTKIISHKLCLLRRIRNYLNVTAALAIMKTMILPIIDNANIFLTSCPQRNLACLQTLQNHLLRCCFKIKDPRDEHVADLHYNSNVITIENKRKINLICSVRDCVHRGQLPLIDSQHTTRASAAPLIRLPTPRTTHFAKSHFYIGSSLWNSLPTNLRAVYDKRAFKSAITFWVQNNTT